MLTASEAQALAAVDDQQVIDSLGELIALPSVGGSDVEIQIQHRLAAQLGELELDTDLWRLDLPALTTHPDFPGQEVIRTESWGLVATSADDAAEQPALILSGHVDVVPPGDLQPWRSGPYAPLILDGQVVGRGANDMKGGLAAILGAVRAVRAAGIRLERPLAVHCVIGEEDGGLGAFATLQRGHTGAACIIPEPTDLQLVTANAGALTFQIEVPGRATHGSTAYAGSSAIDSYLAIHRGLAELNARRNADPEELMRGYHHAYPLSVGRLRAGDWPSSVPDWLAAEGRLGLRIEEDPAAARRELEDTVAAVAARDPFMADHPPVVTWPGGQFRGGRLPAGHALADSVRAAHSDAGGPDLIERGAPWGSDLRLYAGAGVPTLHYGPGDVRTAHGPNECVPIDQLLTTTRVLTLAILRHCLTG